MNRTSLVYALDQLAKSKVAPTETVQEDVVTTRTLRPSGIKKVRNTTISYAERHRGQWHRPEYDFDEIQIAQDTSSYLFRAIKKKTDRFITAGWEFVSENDETLDYVKRRIAEIEWATEHPFNMLMLHTAADLFRFGNAMWVKTRDVNRSSGEKRTSVTGARLDPVAAYHILPFETLSLKSHNNGEIKRVKQTLPTGTERSWDRNHILHFYVNRKPGFSVGTPEVFPALDDISLLRRIEENVEELIETNLFPVYHYKVGNDAIPERMTPNGDKETDIVKKTIEYMPSGAFYVSDHRHEITAIGSESKALRIDFYLTYFKSRVMTALGVSPIDMGEGGSSNRSTSSTLSKNLMMDVEALQLVLKWFIEFYVINELLVEGGYNPLDPADRVNIKFGVVDKEERLSVENNSIQKWLNNGIDHTEFRKELGLAPFRDEQFDETYQKLFAEPLAMLKALGPDSAASNALADAPSSNITTEGVSKEKTFAKQEMAAKKSSEQRGASSSKKSGTVANKSRPANQSGSRSSAKLSRDTYTAFIHPGNYNDKIDIVVPDVIGEDQYQQWVALVLKRYNQLEHVGVGFDTVVENLLPRLYALAPGDFNG